MNTFSTGVLEGMNALHLHRVVNDIGVHAESHLSFKFFSGSLEQTNQDFARLEAVFGLKDSNLLITHPDLHLFSSNLLPREKYKEFDGRSKLLVFYFYGQNGLYFYCHVKPVEVVSAKRNWMQVRDR